MMSEILGWLVVLASCVVLLYSLGSLVGSTGAPQEEPETGCPYRAHVGITSPCRTKFAMPYRHVHHSGRRPPMVVYASPITDVDQDLDEILKFEFTDDNDERDEQKARRRRNLELRAKDHARWLEAHNVKASAPAKASDALAKDAPGTADDVAVIQAGLGLQSKMQKTVSWLQNEFSLLDLGDASTSFLDHIKVQHYGNLDPLSKVASVTADGHTLTVTAFEPDMYVYLKQSVQRATMLPCNDCQNLKHSFTISLPDLPDDMKTVATAEVKSLGKKALQAVRRLRAKEMADLRHRPEKVSQNFKTLMEEEIQRRTDATSDRIAHMVTDMSAAIARS